MESPKITEKEFKVISQLDKDYEYNPEADLPEGAIIPGTDQYCSHEAY